ncbi:vacuolar protein-sorting-associated protein 36 isoform X2 [Drosophila mojavensis]|nr:vacuolar protein-sorting-associated protein 36 isoform X2 [Drosophila mojavensis]EDW06565.1 uncharacterized protein Dmoj_GI21802, isoform A [Drosophila mojavensis]
MNNTQSHSKPQIVWDEEHTVKLIKAYKAQNVLWNPENRGFLHRNARYDAWKEMANVMQLTIRDVKRKMNSLIGVYRSQYRKGVTNPRWWASHMSFMQPKLIKKPNTFDHSENSDNSIGNEPYDSEQEFISAESTQRRYQSAFHEFRAEFEPSRRVPLHEQQQQQQQQQEKEKEKAEVVQQQEAISPTFPLMHDEFVQLKTELEEIEIVEQLENESPPAQPEIESPSNQPENLDDDDVTLYVKYLECKLKKYPPHTRNAIQFEFNRIIYEADLGLHDRASKFS